MMRRARTAARGPHSLGWDNTNIKMSIHVEQRELAPPKVQSGTTSIIYELRNATPEDMHLKPVLERRAALDVINFNSHIRPTRSQMRDSMKHLELDIIKILINNQNGFDYVKDDPLLKHRQYRPPPQKHKTKEFVLRTTTIEESSIAGNIKVNDNIYLEQLEFKDSARELDNTSVPCINDQSTNARIRSAQVLRADDRTTILRLAHLQLAPGFLHVLFNLLWALLKVHRGTVDDNGSLQFYISVLTKTRLGSEHPDYHTLRSFVFQVLFGHILLYWTVETGLSLDEFAASKPTPEKLLKIAARILDKFGSAAALDHAKGTPGSPETEDIAARNAILMIRDLLTFYELSLAISSGDFGRVEILLGTLTMMFAGSGCTNYTSELLHFIQNLRKVWTPELA